MKPQLKILSLGWGVQSWTMAAMMALDELPRADYVIHADTTYERASTYQFAERWAPWLGEHGVTVDTVRGRRNDVVMADHSNSVMIPAFTINAEGSKGQVRRQCTHDWKVLPVRRLVRERMAARGIRMAPVAVDEAIRDKRPPFALSVHPGRKPLPAAVVIPEDFGASQPTFDVFEACDSGFCWT